MLEPFSKTALALITLTAMMGAIAKIIEEKLSNKRDIIVSLISSATSAYLAFLLGIWFQATDVLMHVLVWAGAYMGRELGEVVAEAIKIALANNLKAKK